MTRAALSVYMYGLFYVTTFAPPFLLFPHYALGLFGLSAGDDLWIRFAGLLVGTIGGFYVAGVLTRMTQLYGWSVPARFASAVFMASMVALGNAGAGLLTFAALDAVTASITWVAIRADAAEAAGKAAA